MRHVTDVLALKGADGRHPVVGIDWWTFTDKTVGGERTNFGLVTTHDNAYDGREARVQKGADSLGRPIGKEDRDFGDFLTGVTSVNREVELILRREAANGRK